MRQQESSTRLKHALSVHVSHIARLTFIFRVCSKLKCDTSEEARVLRMLRVQRRVLARSHAFEIARQDKT